MSEWRFADPPNVATITVRQIVHGGAPILLVSHDAEDGGWQFLTADPFVIEDGMVVALREIVALDPSVEELADLPVGWQAWRERATAGWIRGPNEAKPG